MSARGLPPASANRPWCPNEKSYGDVRKRVRCPDCSRVLMQREVFVDGDFMYCVMPPHKVKVKTYKRPSRSTKGMGRKGRR